MESGCLRTVNDDAYSCNSKDIILFNAWAIAFASLIERIRAVISTRSHFLNYIHKKIGREGKK
jgi:hypothetical protein